MGLFKKMRAKSAYDSAMEVYDRQKAAWEDESGHVEDLLTMVTRLDEVYALAEDAGFSIRLKPGEHILLGMKAGSALVEPRVSRGSYQGGSQGMSFRVAKGVSFRVGQHRGTYQPGPEVQKAIDTGGDAYITTTRVIYNSSSRNREWAYDKTVDLFHSDNFVPGWGVTYIGVSNRQKTSGFAYGMDVARTVRDRLQLALAVHDGTVDDMIAGLREQSRDLAGKRPVPPSRPLELDG